MLFVAIVCSFVDVTSADDGSDPDQYLSQALFDDFVASVVEGKAVENISFQSETRCVCGFDGIECCGVIGPPRVDQSEISSLVGGRCWSFNAEISANGFCIGVVNDAVGVWIFVDDHDDSYFDGHGDGRNGVHEILGVAKSLIGTDESFTFGVDDTVGVVMFWWSKSRFIWSSTSGVSGDWIWFIKYDDFRDCCNGGFVSLFGRCIGPGPCCINLIGSILIEMGDI